MVIEADEIETLNTHGAAGWELVAVIQAYPGVIVYNCFFKRPVSDAFRGAS